MSLYTVISPKEEHYQQYEDFIKSYSKVVIDLCIKEYGTLGNHPHLNIIWNKDVDIRTDKFTEKLKRHMKDLPGIESPVLIRTSRITDIGPLIGSYLVKEACHEVLIDTGVYDLSLYRTRYSQKFKVQSRFNGILNYTDAVSVLMEYCETHGIDYPTMYVGVAKITGKYLASNCNGLKRLLGHISKEYKLQVSHLLRKAEELHVQLLFMLVDPDQIDF